MAAGSAEPVVAVVGGGAMGGLLAARLARAGATVWILDISEELVRSVNESGIAIEGSDAFVAHPVATTNPTAVPRANVVFFFVKSPHTSAAADLARPIVQADTVVVSLQNGWGNADVLAKVFDPQRLVVGVTYHSATVLGPGRVAHTGRGATFIGPYLESSGLDSTRVVGGILAAGGIEATCTATVLTEIWRKLVLNAAVLPVAGLTGLRAAELGQPGPLVDLIEAVATEAVAVAGALGFAIDRTERLERIRATLSGAGLGKPSMLQDVEERRLTEIDVINGAVVRDGERLGVEVPLNKALLALIHGLERGWRR